MAFTPIVRWRNFTLKNFKAILDIYPDLSRTLLRQEANDVLEDNLGGYKRTAYQFACQLGIEDRSVEYLKVQDYLFTFSDENLEKYLEFWIKTYYAPNPYVSGDEDPIIIYQAIAESILNSYNLEIDFADFFDRTFGGKSYDILLNLLIERGKPLLHKKQNGTDLLYVRREDSESLREILEKIKNDFPIPDENNKSEFFKRFSYDNFCSFFDIDNNHINEKKSGNNYASPKKKINKAHNRIVFGAPGTGKSYRLKLESFGNEKIKGLFNPTNIETVTFHPSYLYSQFVGTYKPRPIYKHHEHSSRYSYTRYSENDLARLGENDYEIVNEPHIVYEYVPGPFLKLLARAIRDYEVNGENCENYLIIVEEINRANVSSVFGDIFQLLDRDGIGKSEYTVSVSEDMQNYLSAQGLAKLAELYLPPNFYIWSTMNTADQGVQPMDTAFKRRWNFEYVDIDEGEGVIEEIYVNINGYGKCNWNKFRKNLNKRLTELNVREDKLIGPFFIKKEELKDYKNDDETESKFQQAFKNKLIMYLSEDVFKHNKKDLFGEGNRTLSQIYKAYGNGEKLFTGLNENFIVGSGSHEQEHEIEE